MLAKIISLVTGCVTFLGGFLVVWGAVQLGRSFGNRGGGGEGLEAGIATIAGGAFIIAAAVYFGQLDTSWMPA